eukprot:COSAG05_NODE_263_length_12683_cov_5.884218_6_plen_89_part_00
MEGSCRDGILFLAAALRGGYHSQDERSKMDKLTAKELELKDILVECLQQRAALRDTSWLAGGEQQCETLAGWRINGHSLPLYYRSAAR